MSSSVRRTGQTLHDADPWWSATSADTAAAGAVAEAAPDTRAVVAQPRRRRAARRAGHARALAGLAALPLVFLARVIARSPRLRTLVIRGAMVCLVLLVLACSVGVILINNIVIGRTAELGKLDRQRRELRRDNAQLGAELAKLQAPTAIQRRATAKLGMVANEGVPTYVYLDPKSRMLTDQQRTTTVARRARAAALAAARARAAAARSNAQPASTATGVTAATGSEP